MVSSPYRNNSEKGAQMNRRPTVYQVAERAGVSIATVSFAFRQPNRVRPTTRDAVLAAARELGYVPSASARGLARGHTGAFGMYSFNLRPLAGPSPLSPEDESGLDPLAESDPRIFPVYVDEVQRGFELECQAAGLAVLLASSAASDRVMDTAGRVDGLAVFTGPRPVEALDVIAQRVPIVAFNTGPEVAAVSHVRVDNRAGVRAVVEHLVEGHGYTDLAFAGETEMYDFAARFEAFREALAERGLPVPPAPLPPDRAGRAPRNTIRALAQSGALPRAIVCASDQLALDVMESLAGLGITVPAQVAVTGFDGILAGRLSRPTLTTVRQPMTEMGRLAVQILQRLQATPGADPETHELPVRLVPRGSCGCPDA